MSEKRFTVRLKCGSATIEVSGDDPEEVRDLLEQVRQTSGPDSDLAGFAAREAGVLARGEEE